MLREWEIETIRLLQAGLPLVARPYQVLAEQVGLAEAELLDRIATMKREGLIKRVAAVVRHHHIGFTANAMVVWKVAAADLVEVGERFAGFPQVSHCYQRVTAPDWPYNLYTMIHGRTREECLAVVRQLAKETGSAEYEILFSRSELKKDSMKYY